MGTVYLAEHLVIGRKAAIKVLHEGTSADASTVAQFFDEARAANKVHHPGIVDIHDCGCDPEVGPYLVMEYLEGESLGDALRREGALSLPETVRVVALVADILEAVHGRGIVHRDLKPDNILLTEPGQLKVVDFGVAQLAHRPQGTHRLMGTPHYMAPEQCAGEEVDHRTDIYALGVITYEVLTGLPPFDNRDHRKVMALHQHEPPPPPSAINPVVPAPVERVVLRALEKKPAMRFASVWEFAVELAQAAREPLPERTPLGTPHARRPIATSETWDTIREPAEPAPVQVLRPCPHCRTQMLQPVRFNEVELDLCPTCRGVWFDQGEEREVALHSMGEDPTFRELATELGQRLDATQMRCPCCEEPLATYRFTLFDELELEICELCGGLWLEHGEMAQIQRSRAEQVVRHLAGRDREGTP